MTAALSDFPMHLPKVVAGAINDVLGDKRRPVIVTHNCR